MQLQEILKNDRMNKGLTQEEYAKVLDITRGTLSHLEKGRVPGPATIKKLTTYFKKPFSELIGQEKIDKLAALETTNMVIDSLIDKGEIAGDTISDAAKKLIWSSLELEIKLKLELKARKRD